MSSAPNLEGDAMELSAVKFHLDDDNESSPGLLIIIATLDILSWKPLGENPGPPQPINWYTGTVLFMCIFINTLFNAYQLRKTSNLMASFTKMIPTNAQVLRHGQWTSMSVAELQRGDVVQIEAGSKVPADLRMFECNGLAVDNSMLTGESEPVRVSTHCTSRNYMETRNMCFFGSSCVEGQGTGVVVSIGDDTVMGKISAVTGRAKRKRTTLEKEISRFVRIICTLIFFTGIAGIFAWVFWVRVSYPDWLSVPSMIANMGSFTIGYTPEGLSVALTSTLAIIARRMARNHVLVKDLNIIETFNTISLIASDKTGTLTKNLMTVVEARWGTTPSQGAQIADVEKREDEDHDRNTSRTAASQSSTIESPATSLDAMSNAQTKCLLRCAALCSGTSVSYNEGASASVHGDASDTAITRWVMSNVEDILAYRAARPSLATLRFNSRNKYMLSVHNVQAAPVHASVNTLEGEIDLSQPNGRGRGKLLLMKGAPEVVLARCSYVLQADGKTMVPLDDTEHTRWAGIQEELGARGRRVLGFAQCWLPDEKYPDGYEFNVNGQGEQPNYPTTNLTFLGVLALVDPPRPEVPVAIQRCRAAHIRVAMVTGDHATTAAAIAEQIGLISMPKDQRHTFEVRQDGLGRPQIVLNVNGKSVAAYRGTRTVGDEPVEGEPLFCKLDPHGTILQEPILDEPCLLAGSSVFPRSLVLVGSQLPLLDSALWSFVLRHEELVFARTTPEQKLKIVMEAQRAQEIVAVTGDGVNDAPALRASNLGIAMFAGSEVAREAGHVLLLDNNFNSIVVGIELGRCVFDNLKKVIIYLLPAGTWSEMLTVMVNIFFGIQSMLSAFLMIIICLCTDVFVSVALVNETAESDIMTRHPRKKDDHLVNAKLMCQAYLVTGLHMFFAGTINYFLYAHDQGLDFHCVFWAWGWGDGWCGFDADYLQNVVNTGQSIFFVTLVIMQWGNCFAVRTRRMSSLFQHNPFWGPHRNLYLPVGIFAAFLMCLFVTLTPFFNVYFGTAPVPIKYALIAVAWAVWLVMLDEARKYVVRRWPNSIIAKVAW